MRIVRSRPSGLMAITSAAGGIWKRRMRPDLALRGGRRAERVEQGLEQRVPGPPAGAGREPHRVGALGDEADPIVGVEVLAGDRPCGTSRAQDHVLTDLGLAAQRIGEGIEHDHHIARPLRMAPVHVRLTTAQRGAPVEIAHPVARLIGADLGEVVAVAGATPGGMGAECGMGGGRREQLVETRGRSAAPSGRGDPSHVHGGRGAIRGR